MTSNEQIKRELVEEVLAHVADVLQQIDKVAMSANSIEQGQYKGDTMRVGKVEFSILLLHFAISTHKARENTEKLIRIVHEERVKNN